MLPHRSLFQALIWLALPAAVLGRRGGGDGDSDSSGGGDSGGDSSGGGSTYTPPPCDSTGYILTTGMLDLAPGNMRNWTSDADPYDDIRTSVYDGSYFYGVASLDYNMTGDIHCPNMDSPVRLLAYAYLAPQPPYPEGPKNSHVIGFKAWESDLPVEEINRSYDKCNFYQDMVYFTTTRMYAGTRKMITNDLMDMEFFADPTNTHKTLFNGSTGQEFDENGRAYDGTVRLPSDVCVTDRPIQLWWPAGATINGSITNDALNFTLTGTTNTTIDYKYNVYNDEARVSFSLTFTGTFDSQNSTQKLNITDNTLAWEQTGDGSLAMALSWDSWLFWGSCILFYLVAI